MGQVMENFVNCIKSGERLLGHAGLDEVLPKPTGVGMQTGAVISAVRAIGTARLACDSAVALSFRKLHRITSELAELKPIVEFASSFDPQAYKAQERTLQQCRNDMLLLRFVLSITWQRGAAVLHLCKTWRSCTQNSQRCCRHASKARL